MTLGELAWPVRVGFSVALLASLAAAEVFSDAFYWPLAVVAGFLFVVLPVVARLFGRRTERVPRASGRVVIIFAAVLTLLAVIEVALVPDFGLGATFWIVAILIPSIEVLGYLARREARAST